MDIVNIADLAGFLFLGFGLLDGYRKGLVKKGASLLFTVGSLFLVYLISPYVENFLRQILPSFLNLDNISVEICTAWSCSADFRIRQKNMYGSWQPE